MSNLQASCVPSEYNLARAKGDLLCVSPNFLQRIAEPAAPLHRDDLAYKRAEITRAKLISQLPHVAMLGDSVCTGIYISSPWSTLWRAHTSRGKNWFLHLDAALSVCSISKGLQRITPLSRSNALGLVRS